MIIYNANEREILPLINLFLKFLLLNEPDFDLSVGVLLKLGEPLESELLSDLIGVL